MRKIGCGKCGMCCKNFSLTDEELAMFKYILKDKFKNKVKRTFQGLNNVRGRCPFLREDNSCGIYEIRPQICRIYPRNDSSLKGICENERLHIHDSENTDSRRVDGYNWNKIL